MADRTGRATAKRASRASGSRRSAGRAAKARSTRTKATHDAEGQPATGKTASRLIDERMQSLSGWRGETLAAVRRLIRDADPRVTEECKWRGTPVWSHAGIVCTGETYKQVVKLTFARGASLADPAGLFNSSLDGNTRRAIDIREGEVLDAPAFKALIRDAVAENLRRSGTPASASAPKPRLASKAASGRSGAGSVKLLSGGNPQIDKADGDAPVQSYIAAMPGWKSDLGRRLDALIVRTEPGVHKAVKWNSPFYGIEGRGWFLSFHVFTRCVKVTFFAGTSLRPVPPGGTPKSKDVRWVDLYEGNSLDEALMGSWIRQAAALPGWVP